MKIVTPAGETYRVHRRVLPWRRRIREKPDWDLLDAFDVPDVDHLGVLGAILLVIGIVIALPIIVLALLVVGEVLLLLLLLPLFLLARVAFKKPWIVEVTRKRKVVHAESVVGWGAAGRRARALVDELRSTVPKARITG
ncbi:hypothetical protein [Luteimicrobium sp. DT211]|uniref:hypothetical protein n=1 Tax=Luteimicrobium sp. DT211 TaxID=3393412 RepID=UPI003CF9D760